MSSAYFVVTVVAESGYGFSAYVWSTGTSASDLGSAYRCSFSVWYCL